MGEDMASRTLFVSHNDMLKHSPKVDFEAAERIHEIQKYLHDELVLKQCRCITSRPATDEELLLAHDGSYLEVMKKINTVMHETSGSVRASPRSQKALSDQAVKMQLIEQAAKDKIALADCELNAHTVNAARLAAGSVIQAANWVLTGNELGQGPVQQGVRNALAVIRPPGHHACGTAFSGFCFFNNVAVAALDVVRRFGLRRVLIVDWDVHHGDGTQRVLEKHGNDSILFTSIHRYGSGFFPGTGNVGEGGEKNRDRFINIPLTPIVADAVIDQLSGTFGDREYLEVFRKVLVPLVNARWGGMRPELILVSSGFDAGEGDKLGGFNVTPAGYAAMLQVLCSMAEEGVSLGAGPGRVVVATEGGYTPSVNAKSANAVIRTLLNAGRQPTKVPNLFPLVPATYLDPFPWTDETSQQRTEHAIGRVLRWHVEGVRDGDELADIMGKLSVDNSPAKRSVKPESVTPVGSDMMSSESFNTPVGEIDTPFAKPPPTSASAPSTPLYTAPAQDGPDTVARRTRNGPHNPFTPRGAHKA